MVSVAGKCKGEVRVSKKRRVVSRVKLERRVL